MVRQKMKYAIIENGVVVNLAIADQPLAENWIEFDGAVNIGDLYDGEAFNPPPPVQKSADEIKAEIMTATQQRLDTFAGTRDYNSILSACTYATSAVPQFKRDGQYCVNARDATWGKLYTMLAEVEAGTRPMPSGYADIEGELPVLQWPTT
jgi:hypothetical protein